MSAARLAAHVGAHRQLGIASRRHRVPRARWPALIESDYAARLVSLIDRIRPVIERALPEMLAGLPRGIRTDVHDSARARRVIERARAEIDDAASTHAIEHLGRDIGARVATQQRGEFERQTRAALGVEPVFIDRGLPGTIEAFAHENASLIQSLQGRTLDEIANIITRAHASGTRAEAVADEIAARFGVAGRHARLISRDQIGKLNSKVAAQRHQELGLTSFEWVSMRDDKVRRSHVLLDRKRFRYDRPPAEGLPGMPVCCRCVPHPVFDDLLALIP